MKNHGRWMLVGCVLPLLIIFLMPLFGIRSAGSMLVVLIAFFGAHLWMILTMEARQKSKDDGHPPRKGGGHHDH